MKFVRKLGWLLMMPALLVCSTGCVWLAFGAGAGAIAYTQGELKSTERAHLSEVTAAAKAGLAELEYRVTSSKEDEVSAKIIAIGADDTEATVRLRRLDVRDTEIRIRFGVVGNETYSRLLLEKIQRRIQ